ncbi:putative Histidinol-phosphatase [Candidatus Desulfarcum epimagneticum]|uniref:Histidinol-phosphatase n=1 Tax=uncultured Desulfobacteraceae bacterium TaxID=218296 RepID=A0A484HFL9_9BACT|nr:putative Histidinol-phosphatase [uncultured Desulfobacteraceae bacterium]
MIDCHIHTRLCGHARGPMEAYVTRALERGLDAICFLDHLFEPDGRDGLSMTFKEIPLYFQAVQRLRRRHRGRIDIKAGLEADFDPRRFQELADACRPFDFDVIAGAVHFPGGVDIASRRSPLKTGEADPDRIYETYFETLGQMAETGFFDVVCHFDLPKKFGVVFPSRSFDREIHDVLLKIKAAGMAVEANAAGFDHAAAEPYPGPDIMRKCFEMGIDAVPGSDAHSPDQVGRHIPRVIEMMRAAGYGHMTIFEKREKKKLPITF